MIEKIESATQVALALLQPSKRDLEHGLELHRESVVCDAYGFAPTAAVDGNRIREEIEAGASDREVQDMLEEMSMTRCLTDADERTEYREAWEASGVTCVFQNAGAAGQDPLETMKRLGRFTYVSDSMRDFFLRAHMPEDILRAKQEEKHCFYMSSNGVPLLQHWVSVEEELGYITVFYQLGTRMMHLTYNRRNMIGDGCGESTDAGLSDFGEAVVAEMNRVGIIVDVAHCGWQTSYDAAKASHVPMVCSHSAAWSLNQNVRCKPDWVIEAIADSGGYMGICCVPDFLGGSGDINALLDHIDYMIKRFGARHVAIGTDSGYGSSRAAAERKSVPKRRIRKRWEHLWPAGALNAGAREPHMLQSLLWTNWPLFTVGLVQRGHTDEDIQRIIGGNMLRVAQAAFDAGDSSRLVG